MGLFSRKSKPQTPEPEMRMVDPRELRISQLDITESEDENLQQTLQADDWVKTVSLIALDPEIAVRSGLPGLPLPGPNDDPNEIYNAGAYLSQDRDEAIKATSKTRPDTDGVYCPVCHIANIELKKLGSPCPKCSRNLLRFGWT